jgi:hypothetical protein
MMHQPRIRSRCLIEEQERAYVVPASDQDAPGRMPVEVLESQMRLFGMHGAFNKYGSSMQAIREVKARVGDWWAESDQPRTDDLVTANQVAKQIGCSAFKVYTFILEHNLKPARIRARCRYFRPADFEALSLAHTQPIGITLPDGRTFRSLSEVSREHGRNDGYVGERLKAYGLAPTSENVWRVLNEMPKRRTKLQAAREWCQAHNIDFKLVRYRFRRHAWELCVRVCERVYSDPEMRQADAIQRKEAA